MTARRIANENRPPSDFLTVSQVAAELCCDRGMVYRLIDKGEILAVRPFHDKGVLRVPRESYQAYKDRLIIKAECLLSESKPQPRAPQARARPRIKADHAAHRAANEWLRSRGILG